MEIDEVQLQELLLDKQVGVARKVDEQVLSITKTLSTIQQKLGTHHQKYREGAQLRKVMLRQKKQI